MLFYITHIIYIAHIIYITHTIYISYEKVTLKHIKKLIKYFLPFILYIKMANNYYQEKQRKAFKKGRVRCLFKAEKDNKQQYTCEWYGNLSEEEKQK